MSTWSRTCRRKGLRVVTRPLINIDGTCGVGSTEIIEKGTSYFQYPLPYFSEDSTIDITTHLQLGSHTSNTIYPTVHIGKAWMLKTPCRPYNISPINLRPFIFLRGIIWTNNCHNALQYSQFSNYDEQWSILLPQSMLRHVSSCLPPHNCLNRFVVKGMPPISAMNTVQIWGSRASVPETIA